jgi:type IV secretion system protein VirB11
MLQAALGPLDAFLQDPCIIEIMLNPDGRVWIERLGEAPCASGQVLDPATAERLLRLVASSIDTTCHAAQPRLSAVLPGSGARLQGFLPPVVRQPALVIRKPALQVFTLDDYVAQGVLTAPQAAALVQAVQTRRNLLLAGGTGSGKTTLANTLLALMATTGDRIVTLEDTPELRCPAPNTLALYTVDGQVTMHDLVKDTLRCRPDRIVIGEVRDGTALDLLKAMGTGHPGSLTTVHANSAPQSLTRLEQLVQEVVVTVPRQLIADAIDMIVYLERTKTGRRVTALEAVTGLVEGQYVLRPLAEGERR